MTKIQQEAVNLTGKAERYVSEAIEIVRRLAPEYLYIALIFGSLISKHVTRSSDVDLLLVFDDAIPERMIKLIDQALEYLEAKYGFNEKEKNFWEHLYRALNRMTGMYKSHFICKKQDLIKFNFARIFNVSRIMSKILAPKCFVLKNFLFFAKVIYGDADFVSRSKKLLQIILPECPVIDWIKSIIMNLLLSLGALFASIFSKKSHLYALEAIKWSFYVGMYYINNNLQPTLTNVIKHFKKIINKNFIERFLKSKRNMVRDPLLLLLAPFYVIYIHLVSKNFQKIIRNRLNRHTINVISKAIIKPIVPDVSVILKDMVMPQKRII